MRVILLAVGRMKKGPETELVQRYLKRAEQAGRQIGLRGIEIIEIKESRAGDTHRRMTRLSPRETEAVADRAAHFFGISRAEAADLLAAPPEVVARLGDWEREYVAQQDSWAKNPEQPARQKGRFRGRTGTARATWECASLAGARENGQVSHRLETSARRGGRRPCRALQLRA